MKFRIIILSVLFSILVGCVSTAKGPAFVRHSSVPADQSYVYFYRPNPNDGVTVCWKIRVNKQFNGCLKPQGFIKVEVSPGQNVFTTKAAAVEFEIEEELKAGKAYYYEIGSYSRKQDVTGAKAKKSINFIFDAIIAVLPVQERTAVTKLANLKESV